MKGVGTLEVQLVEGHDLKDTDVIGKSDPYAIISCKDQEQKSSTVQRGGSVPKWNQSFYFTVVEEISEITIKLFDEDKFTADDVIGTATIPLSNVFFKGEIPVTDYEVLRPSGDVHGRLKVGLKFTPERREQRPEDGHKYGPNPPQQHYEQEYRYSEGPYGSNNDGGWKQ